MEFAPGMGRLHRWDGAAPSVVVARDLVLPNGLGWNADDTVFYLADSYANLLYTASFRPDEGEIGPLRVLVEVDGPGVPDGLAVDVDGCVWVAMSGGSTIRRYSPAGELIGVAPLPVSQPSSCIFGDDGTLFITSARHGLSADRLRAEPLAGSVFALATGTKGIPAESFHG
jgi:sugar lactone lactonase YvrE